MLLVWGAVPVSWPFCWEVMLFFDCVFFLAILFRERSVMEKKGRGLGRERNFKREQV